MSKNTLVISCDIRETRVALIEDGIIAELHIERRGHARTGGSTGDVYLGKVTRVLPGLQAAFIDIGLERTAFLHASDIAPPADAENGRSASGAASIRELVTESDEILVQVLKDPLGSKGARLTTYITLPSRYLVYMPKGHGVGVSSRVEDEPERLRLREAVQAFVRPEDVGGYIVRTAAEGVGAEQLAADLAYLERLWAHVRERSVNARPGEIVHEDLPLSLRVLRDDSLHVERILVDDATEYERMRRFATDFVPEAQSRIELYQGTRPLFDLHAVEEDINRALDRKVTLKSGGYLVIDQTESMTTIDVNTGGYVGYRNLEDTIFRTNLEAAVAIARQLRLRNLGGIIIIDFIDMTDEAHRRQVIEALERSLAGDRAQSHVASLSPLGLVEMTRKRTRESLEHLLCQPCPACDGRGFVRSAETVCQDVFREILRQAKQFGSRELLVLAHQDVVDRLLGDESAVLAELETACGRPIRLQAEALYDVDQYDVVLV